jgi:hypothetical protein
MPIGSVSTMLKVHGSGPAEKSRKFLERFRLSPEGSGV